MSQSIAVLQNAGMPAHFNALAGTLPDMNAAANEGLSAGFAIIGYKGRNWRIKHRGSEVVVSATDAQGRQQPSAWLDVVIVGISPAISKQYYAKRFTEGDDAAPDCFSTDGIQPDASSTAKQSAACSMCPQNIWGSRVNDNGNKIKACQDTRRIAVVPLGDIENASFGGPMMLRVPPMSLTNLADYARNLQRLGAQPYMVGTTLSFDQSVAYPLIQFAAMGWLEPEQFAAAQRTMEDPMVQRVLADTVAAPAEAPASVGANVGALAAAPAHMRPADVQHAGPTAAEIAAQAEAAQAEAAEALAKVAAERTAKVAVIAAAEREAKAAAAKAAAPGRTNGAQSFVNPFRPPAQPAHTPAAQHTQAAHAPAHVPAQAVAQAPDDLAAAIDSLLQM